MYSALHAHTLLLDLEQLVVVANLDKINLNSSSSACSTTNSALKFTASATATTIKTTSTTTTASKSTSSTAYQNVAAIPLNDMKLNAANAAAVASAHNNMHRSTTYQHDIGHATMEHYQFNKHKTNLIKSTNGLTQFRFDTNLKPLVTDASIQMDNSFDLYFSKF